MEDIHGVDVSWLHHSNRDKHIRLHGTSPGLQTDAPPPVSHTHRDVRTDHSSSSPRDIPTFSAADSSAIASSTSPSPSVAKIQPTPPKRPSLINRASGDKATSQVSTDTAKGSSPGRRASWMSSIGNKLSQSSQSPGAGKGQRTQVNGTPTLAANGKPAAPVGAPLTKTTSREQAEPSPPPPPKSGNSGFFSNALRRLSSNTSMGGGKAIMNGGLCPRRILNVDPNRPRCLLPELEVSKLRKVAFCVDVEIAGGPRYTEEGDDAAEKKKKKKDVKLKEKGEGDALKHPQSVVDEKEANAVVEVEVDNAEESPEGDEEKRDKKREKKKKSEEERKERKEQRRKKAEENGTLPVQITRDADENGIPSPGTTPRPMDKPTTDPLRIYRRCCQLRETPVLKRITEQLGNPAVCMVATPGTVSSLDLTGSRLTFHDIMTLSDWLAVVPVRRLILEDSDLTNEGIRVVLAGLLAVKRTDYFARQRPGVGMGFSEEKLGVVEKLSLKNNAKVGKEGWKHISLFIHMCGSLKAIDVSMITFPPTTDVSPGQDGACRYDACDPAELFSKAISERLGGDVLEELIMAECSLSSQSIRKIVDGVTISGLKRLGLAGNRIDQEGIAHITRFLRSGVCQGLDLGSNDLRDYIVDLAAAMHEPSALWALSLADCNLTPALLRPLFPALLKLHNFRFLDLSHNHALFADQPSALPLLRKYIPLMKTLKRLHLIDVSMSPAQAIALAEVIPENSQLAHINLLQNPQLSALASATDVATQEEACALYASLMIAARVSHGLICVDIDVPTPDNSEIVKALAKQVVAYCLRNMETFAATELDLTTPTGVSTNTAAVGERGDGEPHIPEVLLHLMGNKEGQGEEPAANEDYIVGGAGVVKALSYCLSEKASEVRAGAWPTSGTVTPSGMGTPRRGSVGGAGGGEEVGRKAKDMSMQLLESARKIRGRLQPALVKEAKRGDDMAYRRLLFLDNTLQGMIQRFEEEYPDCRLSRASAAEDLPVTPGAERDIEVASTLSSSVDAEPSSLGNSSNFSTGTTLHDSDENNDDYMDARSRFSTASPSHPYVGGAVQEGEKTSFSRRGSEISLASRAQAKEEGHIHRLSNRVKREILPRAGLDLDTNLSLSLIDPEKEPEHLKVLKAKLEAMPAEEFLGIVRGEGWESVARGVVDKAEFLRELEIKDPGELARIGRVLQGEGKLEGVALPGGDVNGVRAVEDQACA